MTPTVSAAIAADLVRALRGTRSQAEFSRRLGYRSNIVQRWESGACWPSASDLLGAASRTQPALARCYERFFQRKPAFLSDKDPFSPATLAAFLRELRGKTPITTLAARTGFNRYSIGRWLKGNAQPRLPEFLCLIEACSRRLLDFLATLTDPSRLSTIAPRWRQVQRARNAAYELPWSHAVLRALELDGYRRVARGGERWIAARLGVELGEVARSLEHLALTGQIKKARGKWRLDTPISVDTSQDPARARELKATWASVALERLRQGAPGNYGYSLFAVTQADLRALRELHLQYVRAMQSVIAESSPGECVGLYCAQLLDLSTIDNALAT
jgi:transcriptional regulator with XRE-family HTH domain